jgi:D-alanyl-D-alanine carboxypeptidase
MSRTSVVQRRTVAVSLAKVLATVLATAGGIVGGSGAEASIAQATPVGARLPDPAPWATLAVPGQARSLSPGAPLSSAGTAGPLGTLGKPTGDPAWLAQASDPGSVLVVVNKRRPLTPEDYVPADLDGASGVLLRAQASEAFGRLAAAADAAGVPVRARSGYRSYQDQAVTFQRWQSTLGDDAAESQSARPGYSEHQTGLALDVVPRNGACQDFGCFADTPHAAWLAEHAAQFGFVVRYQAGQEAVTGYTAEPWHLRYVGLEAAAALAASGAHSIEDYLGLPPAPTY